MAKRRPKRKNQEEAAQKRAAFMRTVLWALIIGVSVLFGVSYGYPLVAEGQVTKGILTGLIYGGGALAALLISLFLNRKLKGK